MFLLQSYMFCCQVFFVQVDESRLTVDTMEITQFSETIANSTCSALAPSLGQLHEHGMKKVALRVTIGPEQVSCRVSEIHHDVNHAASLGQCYGLVIERF